MTCDRFPSLAILAVAATIPATQLFAADAALFDPTRALEAELAQVAQAPPPESAPAEAPLGVKFGAMNTLRWAVEGDWIYDWGSANMAQGRVGLQWFVFDNVELAMYGTVNYVWQPQTNAFAGGFDMQLRWHFLNEDTWSVFAEIGGGILGSTEPVPANGSSFNFTPNVGIGATLALDENTRLYVGLRWFHISNAGLYAKNPGRDSSSLWLGVSFKL
ncbi:MAG: acyloxyacyl hydrolase [Phycisphaerae bacterium]|nr:acyloxyacyl hydrolase [Phycisphaerae bacterium]